MTHRHLSSSFIVKSILFGLLFTLLTLTVLVQSNPGTELPNRDYGFYIYIGREIARGNLPYETAWDSKPPAIFYLNALALKIGRGSRWGIWLVEFAFLFAAIVASHHLLKKLWGTIPALFGISIWLWGMDLTLQGGNYTEEYPLVFHFLALILFLSLTQNPRQRLASLTLGILFSISFLFRPNNALTEAIVILVFGASLLWKRDWQALFHAVFWVTLGMALPLAITSAYFAWHGQFQALLEASILYNLAYSTTDMSATLPWVVGFQYLVIPAWISLTGYLLIFSKGREIFSQPLYLVMLIGAPIIVILSDPARRNYGHYFLNWLPFVALLSAFAMYSLQQKILLRKSQSEGVLHLTPVLALFLLTAYFFIQSGRASTYTTAFERLSNPQNREIRSQTAIYVENHTNSDEYVIFWAITPGEYFMAHRNAPTPGLFYPHLVTSSISDRLNDAYLADLIEKKPVLIVDLERLSVPSLDPIRREEQKAMGVYPANPPHNLDEVLAFIEKNYYLEAEVKGRSIYRLSGTQEP